MMFDRSMYNDDCRTVVYNKFKFTIQNDAIAARRIFPTAHRIVSKLSKIKRKVNYILIIITQQQT